MAPRPSEALGLRGEEAVAIAESLLPGCWPTADAAELRLAASRAAALADAVDREAENLAALTRTFADAWAAGEFREAVVDGLAELSGTGGRSLPGAAELLRAVASSLDTYAEVVTETEQQMATIALLADRDLRRADVLAEVGDDSWRVSAASAGRLALTAAGDDHADRAGEAGQGPAPAATSGMMPFAPLGALGAAGLGAAGLGATLGARAADSGVRDARGVGGTADVDWLRRRAERLQAGVSPSVAGWLRTAVGVGVSGRGNRVVVVGTNDPQPYQRAGLDLDDDEALTANGRAPELAIVEHMAGSGVTPRAIATATPMDAPTLSALRAADIVAVAPGENPARS